MRCEVSLPRVDLDLSWPAYVKKNLLSRLESLFMGEKLILLRDKCGCSTPKNCFVGVVD